MKLKLPPLCPRVPLWLVLSLATFSFCSQAAEPHSEMLSVSESLSLGQVVDSALQRAPEFQLAGAYGDVSGAYQRKSRQWLAGSPSVSLAYQTDEFDTDLGFRESQIGVTLPVWRWRQKDAFENLAEQSDEFAQRYPEAIRLDVSGRVRESLWSLAALKAERTLANEALEIARQLESKVAKQVELGNVPRADQIAASRERLARESRLMKSESEWRLEQQHYFHLTGLEEWPSNLLEESAQNLETESPQLALSRIVMEQREAELAATRSQGNGQPEVTVAARRERADRSSESQQYLALELAVPIGGKRYSGINVTDSLHQLASARSQYQRLKITLEAAREEAQTMLSALQQRQSLSKQQLSLAQQQYRMDQRSYGAGVMNLLELMRTQSALLESKRDHQLLQLQIGRTRAELNQASGTSL